MSNKSVTFVIKLSRYFEIVRIKNADKILQLSDLVISDNKLK